MKSNPSLIRAIPVVLFSTISGFVYGVNTEPTFLTIIEAPISSENSHNKVIVPEKYFNELKDQTEHIEPINLKFNIEFNQKNSFDLDSFQFFSKDRKNSERNISKLVLSKNLEQEINQYQNKVFEIIRNEHSHVLVHKRKQHSKNENILTISIPLTYDNIYLDNDNGKMFFVLLVKDLHEGNKASEYKLELAPHKIKYKFDLTYSDTETTQASGVELAIDESNVDISIQIGKKSGLYKARAENQFFEDELENDSNGTLSSSISMVPKYALSVDEKYIKKHTITKRIQILDGLEEKELNSTKATSAAKSSSIISPSQKTEGNKPVSHKANTEKGEETNFDIAEVKKRILNNIPTGSFNGTVFSKTIGKGKHNLYSIIALRINSALKQYNQTISVDELIKYNNTPPKKLPPKKLYKGKKVEFDFENIFNEIAASQ